MPILDWKDSFSGPKIDCQNPWCTVHPLKIGVWDFKSAPLIIVEVNHGCCTKIERRSSQSIDFQELLVALVAVGVKVWRNPTRCESFPGR